MPDETLGPGTTDTASRNPNRPRVEIPLPQITIAGINFGVQEVRSMPNIPDMPVPIGIDFNGILDRMKLWQRPERQDGTRRSEAHVEEAVIDNREDLRAALSNWLLEVDKEYKKAEEESYKTDNGNENKVRRPQRTFEDRINRLLKIFDTLSNDNWVAFRKDEYVLKNLNMFLEINPQKIETAFHIKKLSKGAIDYLRVTKQRRGEQFNEQFVDSMVLHSYVILEKFKEMGLDTISVPQAFAYLDYKINGPRTNKFEEAYIYKTLRAYLRKVNPYLRDTDREKQLVQIACGDLYKKQEFATNSTSYLDQSQGIEIEVIKHGQAWDKLKGKHRKRGSELEKHKRLDWNLLPLLGMNEDIGERPYQAFEMSANPSDSSAMQNTLIYQLIAGGFVSERLLSSDRAGNPKKGKESFSLHINTAFPTRIVNKGSMREYRDFARVIAGAYATDDRLQFAGFMSGGREIADKSAHGNMKEVKKIQSEASDVPRGKSLIEIRSLDISAKDHFSAIYDKQFLDYCFRWYWEKQANPSLKLGPLEEFAARRWRKFNAQAQAILSEYKIDNRRLYRKYGASWREKATTELAKARLDYPLLKQRLHNLIKEVVKDVKAKRKEQLRSSGGKEAEAISESSVRFLLFEPLGKIDDRVYLSEEDRKRFGVAPGDMLTLNFGGERVGAIVAQAKLRGDGKTEDPRYNSLRLSKNILESLGLPNGYGCLPEFDSRKKELKFRSIETEDPSVVKFKESRKILHEPKGEKEDRIYLNQSDREKLGVNVGETIYLKCGKVSRRVMIAPAKKREDGGIEEGSWRISRNILKIFGLPEGYSLRGRFEKSTGELSFGPLIAELRGVNTDEKGEVTYVWGENKDTKRLTFYEQLDKQAMEYGVFHCLVDPNKQTQEDLDEGYCRAYILQNGRWVSIRIPIPDIVYDKDTRPTRRDIGEYFVKLTEFNVIPRDQINLTSNKSTFAEVLLGSKSVAEYHPDTEKLEGIDTLKNFMQKYSEVILKPQFGQRSKGLIRIGRVNGEFVVKYPKVYDDKNTETVEKKVATLEEAYSIILEQMPKNKKGNPEPYIMQEKVALATYTDVSKGIKNAHPEFRTTFQRGINGEPVLTGMMVRLHDPNLILANEEAETPIRVLRKFFGDSADERMSELKDLGFKALQVIEKSIGQFAGEITFDIAIKANGKPVIIEANSMAETRNLFKLAKDEDGAYHATARPIEYTLFKTDMN